MKFQKQSERKARTRQLVQAGGLLHKSGLLEVFSIQSGDDLQDYENRIKVIQLLGFLVEAFEKSSFGEFDFKRWEVRGERYLKY